MQMNKIICQKKIYSTISQHNLNKPIRTKQIAKYENGYIYIYIIQWFWHRTFTPFSKDLPSIK